MMQLHLAHYWAIVRYEFKLHWRGRALKVIFLALLVQTTVAVLMTSASAEAETQMGTVTGEEAVTYGDMITFIVWAPTSVVLALVLPLVVADTIPRDRQLGVSEPLQTTPLADGVYLAAKASGIWLAMGVGAGVVLLFGAVLAFWQFGPFDVRSYLRMCVIGVGSMVVINNGLAVLLTATQPSRTRAILVILIVVAGLFITISVRQDRLLVPLSPLREPIFEYFLWLDVTDAELYRAIAFGLAQLAVVWAGMWGWRRWTAG